jgi:hypothetical protein
MKYITTRAAAPMIVVICSLLLSGLLPGCLPTGPGKTPPTRKKMPAPRLSDGSWEGGGSISLDPATPSSAGMPVLSAPWPFAMADTTIGLGNRSDDFVVLRLPSTDYDYLLLSAKNFEPLLPMWLNSWPQSGRRGIAIDLSTGGSGLTVLRADYRLDCPAQHVSLPVVLLWDAPSAPRASLLTQFIQSLSTVRCERLQSGEQH